MQPMSLPVFSPVADPGGGGQGGHALPPPLACKNRPKKKMATKHGGFIFQSFLAPPSPKFLDPLLIFTFIFTSRIPTGHPFVHLYLPVFSPVYSPLQATCGAAPLCGGWRT